MKPLLLLILLTTAAVAHGQAPAARPIEPIDPKNCVTPECHADIKSAKIVHGPAAADACDACHQLTDAAKHTFTLAREGADLCTYCHEFTDAKLPVVHKPVTLGECISCHDPHGGATRAILREETIPQLCGRCHESITLGQKHLHTPVAEGACDACHAPHGSRFPKLVNAADPVLCLACHDDLAGKLDNAAVVHQTIREDGCLTCHDVHGSSRPFSLVASPPQLCWTCHDDMQAKMQQMKRKHSPVTEEAACVTCHSPHHGDDKTLMKGLQVAVCMSCHSEDIPGYVRGIPEVNDPEMRLHGALARGECDGCHTAHGGQRPLLLVRDFPEGLYHLFTKDRYELCFGCHDARIGNSEKAEGLTAFRDGDRNLHFVHANEGDRGRSCRVCHTPHASANPANIRTTIAYGKWNMPINFAPTDTGGSCNPGCHVLYHYDRNTPVSPNAKPTALPWARPTQTEPPPWLTDQRTRPLDDILARNIPRLLSTATHLRHQDNPEQARKVLDHALKQHPNSIDLQVAMIETLLDLEQPELARRLLNRIRPGALPAPRHNLLRAAVELALNRPAAAKPLLESALREDPDLAEAHLLMARVWEHEQQWQQAAQHYRLAAELLRSSKREEAK